MPVDERKFMELRKQAEAARTASDRAAGQLEATMKRLKDEFGCETITQAEKMGAKLAAEVGAAETVYVDAMRAFEVEWREYAECR